MLVVPGGVLRRCLYLGTAIAGALGLWAEGLSAQRVRQQISPQQVLGDTAVAGWASLRRWVRSAQRLWPRSPSRVDGGRMRSAAVAITAYLASYALVPTGYRTADAMAGAEQIR
jgi:hypothetical protein